MMTSTGLNKRDSYTQVLNMGEIVKMLCQELDIYMYMTLSIIDTDFLYQFNLRLMAPLFTVSFHEMFEKKNVSQDFQKLAGLWLVGEMDNHVGTYGSKVADGFSAFQRRSCLIWDHGQNFCQKNHVFSLICIT